jgi:hypothetical protein
MSTAPCARGTGVDRVHNARATLFWRLITSHVKTDGRRLRQRCYSRLNMSEIMLPNHFTWLLYIIASNACIYVRDYGESTSVGNGWVQYGYNLFLQVMKFILLCRSNNL